MQAGGTHVGQYRGMQGQAVHAGGVQATGAGRVQILRVGGAQPGFPLLEQGGQTGEGGVLGRGAGLGQQAGGFLGLLAEQGHFVCQSHEGLLGLARLSIRCRRNEGKGTRTGRRLPAAPRPLRERCPRPCLTGAAGRSPCAVGRGIPAWTGGCAACRPCRREKAGRVFPTAGRGFSLTEGRPLSYINRPHRDSSGDRGRSFCKEH